MNELDDALLADIAAAARTLHSAGPSSPKVLRALAHYLRGRAISRSVETGSGATTLLFSHLSRRHTVFAMDDGSGSIGRVRSSLLFNPATTEFIEGPTQKTLPPYRFEQKLQAALLDGPHAFPFPQLEYYYIYPHLEAGALLVLDDIHIRTVHELYRFLQADEMFELLEVVDRAAFFRRTPAPAFDPFGDGWEHQAYNRSRLLRFVWFEKLRDSIPASWRTAVKNLGRRGGSGSICITEPRAGDEVGATGIVRGTAAAPSGARLWLLARRSDQHGWWPQGGGPVETTQGKWEQECRYGQEVDAGAEFEIAAVLVDAGENRRLERWVQEARRSGHHPPIPLPRGPAIRLELKRALG